MRVSPSAKLVERYFCSICHVCVRWLITTTSIINSMAKLRIYALYVLVDNVSQIHLMLTALIRPSPTKFSIFKIKSACSGDKFYLPKSCTKKTDIFEWSVCAVNVCRQVCPQCSVDSTLPPADISVHPQPLCLYFYPTYMCVYIYTHANKDRKPIFLKPQCEQRFTVERLWQCGKSHSSRLFQTTYEPARRSCFSIILH